MILRIRIFVNRKILILRIFLRKMIILRKILRIRLILRIRIFVNMGPGTMLLNAHGQCDSMLQYLQQLRIDIYNDESQQGIS